MKLIAEVKRRGVSSHLLGHAHGAAVGAATEPLDDLAQARGLVKVLVRESRVNSGLYIEQQQDVVHTGGAAPVDKAHRAERMRYSYLSATIGSIFVARRAGTRQAASATPTSSSTTSANTSGSVKLTP